MGGDGTSRSSHHQAESVVHSLFWLIGFDSDMASVENVAANTVELTVRCAFQTSKDITVVCPLNWTIRMLKEHLHQVCSSHPAVTSQRLIFSGACLTDDMVIKDVIDQRKVVEGPQVLHLVCPLPQSSPPELRQRQIPSKVTKSIPNASPIFMQPSNASSPSMTNYHEWYQRYYGATSSPEHLERLQQYSRFYAAYMQQWQDYHNFMMAQMGYVSPLGPQASNAGSNGQTMNLPIARALAARDDHTGVVPPNQADANVVQAPQQIPAEANVAAAAAPGGGRDVLDLVYRVFRVLLFLSAVLLYSSVERFLAVITIALFIFFIQLRRNQQRQARVPEPVEPNVNNNNTGEQPRGVAEEVQPAYVAPTPPTGLQIFLATCYSFITSFFTSLVPDNPVPIDLN
ncbi:hypothetical protein KIN20_001038 [Parelaphostrongylus tenuis]|uniref:Ubiquitin-like domain-containing protein n=1 Tax=Parelaphostrongylus tenuis TaxID=148309 RepID=A0AAD5LWD8_PARTN|nr:hypothetical protein KIN20_001038 [Parelaphostrongylus tenuis]